MTRSPKLLSQFGTRVKLPLSISVRQTPTRLNKRMTNKSDKGFVPSVLVVDDETPVRHRMRALLRSQGFKVNLARSGRDAVSKFQRRSEVSFDAIVCDLRLGGPMDGLYVANEIHQLDQSAPIVVFSGLVGDYSETDLEAGGFQAVVEKPLLSKESVGVLSKESVGDFVDTIKRLAARRYATTRKSPDVAILDQVTPELYSALVQHPALLQSIDWRIFEELIADMLETFGYRVDLMRGTKDGGIDVVAFSDAELGMHKYILQAKRWKNKVGVEPVRSLMFLHNDERATKSCLATTSEFTSGAWQLANQYKWQLELRDGVGLQEWVAAAYEKQGKCG